MMGVVLLTVEPRQGHRLIADDPLRPVARRWIGPSQVGIHFGTGDKKLITLMDKEGVECFTKLRTVSANSTLPFYLRLICKKDDIDKILNDVLGL